MKRTEYRSLIRQLENRFDGNPAGLEKSATRFKALGYSYLLLMLVLFVFSLLAVVGLAHLI